MINYIWLGLIVIGVIIGSLTGNLQAVTEGAFEASKNAVTLAIHLIGIMALWLGMMKIAEESGLVQIIAKAVKPVMKWLFPDVPEDHPAMGAMLMNISANMLGLGNAATPLGLKAMQELQKLNPAKEYATNAMCMFLAINTSSVTIIPATVIGYRVSAGSSNPTEIIGTAVFATACSTFAAIMAIKFLQKFKKFRVPEEALRAAAAEPAGGEELS